MQVDGNPDSTMLELRQRLKAGPSSPRIIVTHPPLRVFRLQDRSALQLIRVTPCQFLLLTLLLHHLGDPRLTRERHPTKVVLEDKHTQRVKAVTGSVSSNQTLVTHRHNMRYSTT
jgi:hypothetical protein